ncbi:MAG: FAD-binding protein [Gemmatimonadetes bacterium]|nr:MAG: FAD-binding protein [Gemmatimonadota bacterium]
MFTITPPFDVLWQQSVQKRVATQHSAVELLLEKYQAHLEAMPAIEDNPHYRRVKAKLSEASEVFPLRAVQQAIYYSDAGTVVVPDEIKHHLVNISAQFVVRPGSLADLQAFVQLAYQEQIRYTIRGSGTWPFGGSIPMNKEVVLDLSYLNFHHLDLDRAQLTVAPGTVFAPMRQILRDQGFAFRQEITNPHSGTICGWIATGGLGIGAYKYGHVQESVAAILWLTPQGEWQTLTPDDDRFDLLFDSEGQMGIVAGAVLDVKRLSYVSKPYAFSFDNAVAVQTFVELIAKWELRPSSMIYFDKHYMNITYAIECEHLEQHVQEALRTEDDLRIRRDRHRKEVIERLNGLDHVLVLEFDTPEDYQRALKYQPFRKMGEQLFHGVSFRRLPTDVAHHMWEHRYAPVQMKQKGPSMLVGETILPVKNFPEYMNFVEAAISNWTGNPVKTEAHVLSPQEVLIQTILLADIDTLRHKLYLGLVPFMIQTSIQLGGKPYGTGIWNLPFLKARMKTGDGKHIQKLIDTKNTLDPQHLINQCKFINEQGRKPALKLFQKMSPVLVEKGVKWLYQGKLKEGNSLGKWLWKANKALFPQMVPPQLQAKRPSLLEINSVCAECDSCEKVCPTSDVFGMWGLATPITRRKTANRLARGEAITPSEALGFLVCTRCDNCTRVCPTDIPLTRMFDAVEADTHYQLALAKGLGADPTDSDDLAEKKNEFITRFWDIMKESPLYLPHTLAEQKEEKSHLQHGLNIIYPRGFAYAELFIDPETCIKCGMCAHENACTYGARKGAPREIPQLIDQNCALCNACINYCPQNKAVHAEREYLDKLIKNAIDLEERKFWQTEKSFLRDTTTIQRSPEITHQADIYVTENIIMEIDKESSTGQIPVSGMGQGDRHTGIGFDAERFSHFHIVGPAQNRLHEGDPDEELSVKLGKRHRYCKFDADENLHNPPYHKIELQTPMMYNAVPLDSNGHVELAFIKVAEQHQTLVHMTLDRFLEYYTFFLSEGGYGELPPVIVPRVDEEFIDHLQVQPTVTRKLLMDLWKMPMFEIIYHKEMNQTIEFVRNSVQALNREIPLICGYLEVSEHDIIGGEQIIPHVLEMLEDFLRLEVDVIHIRGKRNKDHYFTTSQAVRAIHHYLVESGRRHLVSLIASGGIRLASDSQKTIQRGAEATLLDFAALLALDPDAYKAIVEHKTTTEHLIDLDIEWAIERLNNQMESRKVQILEVLGAAGFKDLKKTVGEEGRLIDFFQLEERIQKEIFEQDEKLSQQAELNRQLMTTERVNPADAFRYSELKQKVQPLKSPHYFYELGEVNQTVYQRDHVWPGTLIETLGRMAAGDPAMFYLKHVKSVGLLGDGFDVMKILYQRDPDTIDETELDRVQTALPLDKGLILKQPWMLGGKSVGSIGLDTWRAHVILSRELGIQYDTGEGGYPTCFFLNRKGEPIFFTERDIQRIKYFFKHDTHYTVKEIKAILHENRITESTHPHIYEQLNEHPDLKPFLFYEVISTEDEPFVSTELKTGLFGVTKETIKKARRVVIAYSQGAKMGIGGHILARKVNKLVSYLRGIQGLEELNTSRIQQLIKRIEKLEKDATHPMHDLATSAMPELMRANDDGEIYPELKTWLWQIQQRTYELHEAKKIDPIDFEYLIRLSEEVISYSYTSVISPFPFHNCYSIEDVKAFIDMVRMINPQAVISVKVSPSVDIEFIAAGLARIAKDNTEEAEKGIKNSTPLNPDYGMKIEIWLDGPRGGTGASPNIIKGQMGMHLEYAIPLIHDRLVRDGLRNYVKFMVSGGIRTYEDVIKAVALGADGVIWGTAPLAAIGCDRNRNCHDGCSRGIATSNLIMQNLRNVDLNSKQMINAFVIMQMQVIRALAGLGFTDIRQLRGRFDKIQWLGLKERVDFRIRQRKSFAQQMQSAGYKAPERQPHATGQTNCGVAALIGSHPVPSFIMDEALKSMKNRGMDGVGIGKTLCFNTFRDHYAYRVMVKGKLQLEVEAEGKRPDARAELLAYRYQLAAKIKRIFLDPDFDFAGDVDVTQVRESYKKDDQGRERDYRDFGNENTDPGDVFRWFVRVKPEKLAHFIEQEILQQSRYEYIREYFPEVTQENYTEHAKFMQKAEDLFVFNHSTRLTQVLYVWQPADPRVEGDPNDDAVLHRLNEVSKAYPQITHREKYVPRLRKIAAVMSCGKNFAVWKTAGREIPWETPPSPNNIIHVRLATGSIVEQMNAHPFGKLHTALTHNGETTNYEALKQRVEQFGLPPLATTDTEVAALKFHLLAEELEYPDWALFESFSPTTGDDLALVPPELRHQLEEVQRVEFTSSPDGPYQYLCLRHHPESNVTERIDLKDPADLRPSTTGFWSDGKKTFSAIASEEQAIQKMMQLLDQEGLIDGGVPDQTMVSNGMINRFAFNEQGHIANVEFVDRYGQEIPLVDYGRHYSIRRTPLETPVNPETLSEQMEAHLQHLTAWIRSQLPEWDFNTYRWVIENLKDHPNLSDSEKIATFTYFIDYLRTMNTGDKAKSSLLDVTRTIFYRFLDALPQGEAAAWVRITYLQPEVPPVSGDQTLLIDATGFEPEGTNPRQSLGALLGMAYDRGWRNFLLYRVNGQRLISTGVMGNTHTDDVVIDVYGTPGEYFGAFMQGGLVRCHGNAQNFTAMTMHHGTLQIFGNAGKVCGYASKGGTVFILGDVVDRVWTNSVNDPRCDDLNVHVLGSASKYAGESLMGGDFFFGGMYFDHTGALRVQDRPYRGTKLFGGASRGNFLFFDPYDRLDPAQYTHGNISPIDDQSWIKWTKRITATLTLAGVPLVEGRFQADNRWFDLDPSHFKLIVPRGGLKGYESH